MKKIVFYFRFLVFIFSPDHQNHFDYQKFTPFLKQNKKYELLYCIYKLPNPTLDGTVADLQNYVPGFFFSCGRRYLRTSKLYLKFIKTNISHIE